MGQLQSFASPPVLSWMEEFGSRYFFFTSTHGALLPERLFSWVEGIVTNIAPHYENDCIKGSLVELCFLLGFTAYNVNDVSLVLPPVVLSSGPLDTNNESHFTLPQNGGVKGKGVVKLAFAKSASRSLLLLLATRMTSKHKMENNCILSTL